MITASTAEAEAFLSGESGLDGAARLASATTHHVPVSGGTIRVLHLEQPGPHGPGSGGPGSGPGGDASHGSGAACPRPIVFISGWGTIPESFFEFYGALPPDAEVYHVETREKTSSRLDRRTADFSMDRIAGDVRDVMEAFRLAEKDPVLMGTCFGSAVILHGLATGILDAPTVACMDPMARLWMPRWIIDLFGPILPASGLRLLRPLIRTAVLAGMREPVQRQRARDFIDSADVWKWRRAAIQTKRWDFFDKAPSVSRRVFVVNGSHDRFHDSDTFPRMARALPDGHFVEIPVGESRRERLMGVVAGIFAGSDPGLPVPVSIEPFVARFDD